MIVHFREHAAHREGNGLHWGVDPICALLTEHGLSVAPSTYYEHVGRASTTRQERDALLVEEIWRVHAENYGVHGARKVWLALSREGIPVARCRVEQLMARDGLHGAVPAHPPGAPLTLAKSESSDSSARRTHHA